MAVVGAAIVFSGLVILSLAISQIHRLLSIWEPKEKAPPEASAKVAPFPDRCPADIREVAKYYKPLVEELTAPFALASLYSAANQKSFPHPHLTIRCLREAGILIPQGEGKFTWKD